MIASRALRMKFAIGILISVALKFSRIHLINGMTSDLDMASGAKALVFMSLNVAAEAATHKDNF
jgi:hypothetical protein